MNNIATLSNDNEPVCTCPHCNSMFLIRSGFDRGIQRYRCKNCNKTFKATAGTPLHGLHKKEKISRYLAALRKGMSVRKAAQYTGISKNTSFAWRHKFLSSLDALPAVNTTSKISSVEIIQLKYSAKGRKKTPEKNTVSTKTILLQRDRQLELYKLTPEKHRRHATQIFSDCSATFFAASPNKTITSGIKHAENAVKISNRQLSQLLISDAKRQKVKLLNWMERFKGVASKYLQNYWNWYAALLNLSLLKQETACFSRLCTYSRSLSKYLHIKDV